jgi:hypothetical protein
MKIRSAASMHWLPAGHSVPNIRLKNTTLSNISECGYTVEKIPFPGFREGCKIPQPAGTDTLRKGFYLLDECIQVR